MRKTKSLGKRAKTGKHIPVSRPLDGEKSDGRKGGEVGGVDRVQKKIGLYLDKGCGSVKRGNGG